MGKVAQTQLMDVVIPARNEAIGLAACLASLLAGCEAISLNVVVVLNGEGQAAMNSAIKSIETQFFKGGHKLTVYCSKEVGKSQALNIGDQLRSLATPVVYLDADCRLAAGSLQSLYQSLCIDVPKLAAPRLKPVAPPDRFVQSYIAVWNALPSIQGQFLGAGCYAVNSSGRRRWTTFPPTLPDDAFVRSLFARNERFTIASSELHFPFPNTRDLPATVNRWSNGNRQLRRLGKSLDGPGTPLARRSSIKLIIKPHLWRHLPAYFAILIASKWHGSRGYKTWSPDWIPNRPNNEL